MRKALMQGVAVFGALLFVVGVAGYPVAVSGRTAAVDPDITISFHGLMVFDRFQSGSQVIRINSTAANHHFTVQIIGPDYDMPGVVWAHDLQKTDTLAFNLLDIAGTLDPGATWGTGMPFNMKPLHPTSASLGDFTMVPDAFGPILTINAGAFSAAKILRVDFVSIVSPPVNSQDVAMSVNATITLSAGQIGYLTGAGLTPFPLTKPASGKPKWQIYVSNDPDFTHECSFHFKEYYNIFRYTNGVVPPQSQYLARLSTPTVSPCDGPTPLTLRELIEQKAKKDEKMNDHADDKMMATRPCIPVSFY